ncbi:hypothetical protein KR044_009830, partial [Drosophila immigrans]
MEADLLELVRHRKLTDIKVNVHGHEFNCHQIVLHLKTDYFKNVTVFECAYINSEEVTPLGFQLAYEWMTKQEVVPQREHIVELYMTARFLKMPELEELLSHDFESRELFNEGQAFQLFLETLPFEESPLQQLMLTRVSHFFFSAIASVEFLQMSAWQVRAMLSSNVAAINSELEIFMCVVRWLQCAWGERKVHLKLLISAVRFHIMPPGCLLALKGTQSDARMQDICGDPFVQQRMNEGLSYAITHQAMTEQRSLQEPGELQGGSERAWIIDPQAAHHHVYECPNWKPLDYVLFSAYIGQVINAGPQFCGSLKAKTFANLMPCCQAKYSAAQNTLN